MSELLSTKTYTYRDMQYTIEIRTSVPPAYPNIFGIERGDYTYGVYLFVGEENVFGKGTNTSKDIKGLKRKAHREAKRLIRELS